MPVMTLREKHHPIVPCICENCRVAVLACKDGERLWEQRVKIHHELQARLRSRLKGSFDDPCDVAERRRVRRAAVVVAA